MVLHCNVSYETYMIWYIIVFWCVLMLRPTYFPNTYIFHFLLSPFSSWGAPMWTELPGCRVQILRATVWPGDWWDSMWTEWYVPLRGGKVCGRSQSSSVYFFTVARPCLSNICEVCERAKEYMCFATKAYFFKSSFISLFIVLLLHRLWTHGDFINICIFFL